jgi:hypothetical protein
VLDVPGHVVAVGVSSVPILAWHPNLDTLNCTADGDWTGVVPVPGTFYRVFVSLNFPSGLSCNAEGSIVYQP